MERDKKGVFNIAGTDFISRYEYVNRISTIFGLDKDLIKKGNLRDLNLKAPRPKKAGLDSAKMVALSKDILLGWVQGLILFKKELEFL